jgi:hypothetical protein
MPKSVRLYYRHVNHGERYQTAEMQVAGKNYHATIPAGYTNTKYPIEYYFELKEAPESTLYPGFNPELTNQPYFVVSQT